MTSPRFAFLQNKWEDNIGLLTIVAVLKQHGFDATVLVEEGDTYEELRRFRPDVVGYSCYTGQQDWVTSSIRRMRAAGIAAKVIVGGPHATFFPEILEHPLVDVICRGEGEYALLDYARALESGQDAHTVQNLSFKSGGRHIHNPLRPLVADLDELPAPDRSYYGRYPFLASNPYRIFITGRGCPYRCTFCFNHALHALYGNKTRYVRRRSVDKTIAELLDVKRRWGLDQVRFSDDHFALQAPWLREFAPRYRKEIGRPFTVNARVDLLDEEKVELLKESGCRLVCFGVETGREDLRNRVLKKRITDEQIRKAARLLKRSGIRFLTSNIIGLPGETPDDAWKTIELNREIGSDLPWFSMMQYYPGTEIHRDARERGLLGADFGVDSIHSYFENNYLRQDRMDELQNIHSFSILASKSAFAQRIARRLCARFKPNRLFRTIFQATYLALTLRRADFKLSRVFAAAGIQLRGWRRQK